MATLFLVKQDEMTFENVIKPFIDEEHEVLYAFHTLWLRMLTDWPDSVQTQHEFAKVYFNSVIILVESFDGLAKSTC